MRGACCEAIRSRINTFTASIRSARAACNASTGVTGASCLFTHFLRRCRALEKGMEELMRTNDPTEIAFAQALLRAEEIEAFVMDVHMSALEGSIGILPRRVLVAREHMFRARAVLRDNGIEPCSR